MRENKLQNSIVLYFNALYPDKRFALFCVNNNSIGGLKGAHMKALGVVAGVSDLILLGPDAKTYFIELKTDKGTQSPAQRWFQQNVVNLGYDYRVIRSLEEFKELVRSVWIE